MTIRIAHLSDIHFGAENKAAVWALLTGPDPRAGLRDRPTLRNHAVVGGRAAVLIPGKGFEDIYATKDPLVHAFMNVVLQF